MNKHLHSNIAMPLIFFNFLSFINLKAHSHRISD